MVFRLEASGLLVCSFPNVNVLHRVIDNLSGYVGMYTRAGVLIDCNAAPLEEIGVQREEVIGKYFWNTPWFAHSLEVRDLMRSILARAGRGEVVREDFTARVRGGKVATFQGTFGPIHGEEGDISMIVGFAVDVTDRERAVSELREKEALFRTFIDNTPSLIALKSVDGRFLLANKAQADLGNLRDTDVFGKTSFDIFAKDQADRAVAHDQQVIARKSVVSEERVIQSRRGKRDILVTKFPIFSGTGEVEQIGVVGTDITDTKQAEEAIRLNEHRIRHLEQNLSRLERVSSLGTMLSGLAHELNQPLAALQVYSNRLAALGDDWNDPPEGMLDTLGEMQRLTILANKIILRLRGSVEPSFVEPRMVNCTEAIDEVLELVRPDIAAAGIDLVFQRPSDEISVLANTIDLQLILSNLIRNSREALDTVEDRQIRIDVESVEAQGLVRISVADNGPGMDDGSKKRVFTPFYTTKQTGMGLGLSMAQGLAEGMNARLEILDNKPCGAIVRLCLSRSEP